MMDAYRSFVRQNKQWISSFESLANTATWFLPERFTQSELTPEAVSTMLGLVTVMNQHIIETTPCGDSGVDPHQPAGLKPEHDDSVPWSLCISVMKEVEVLTEMVAEHYLGKDKKWGPVASVEAIKVLLRLIIFKKSGYKMLLDGGETKNEDTGTGDSNEGPSGQEQVLGRPVQIPPALPYRDRFNPGFYPRDLEGRAMQAMHKFRDSKAGANTPSWRMQPQRPREDFRPQGRLLYNSGSVALEQSKECHISGSFICGEVLLISRPLLYVLLVWRYGLKSWRPWVAALSIDLAGMYLASSSTSLPQKSMSWAGVSKPQRGSRIQLSTNEVLELRRRRLRWALYILRNPFFDRFARRPVEAAEQMLAPVPIVGMLAAKAVDLLLGVQGIYSYTAAS